MLSRTTRCTVVLRKTECSNVWRLILLSYPVYVNGKPKRKTESVNRIISTPIWEKCPRGSLLKPKRDKYGIIQCRSKEDQYTCRYADHFRMVRQQEYDRIGILNDTEKPQSRERDSQDFIMYYKNAIRKYHPESDERTLYSWKRVAQILTEYSKGSSIPFNTIDASWLTGMKNHILSLECSNRKGRVSHNTASHYFSALKAGLRMAYVDGYLSSNVSEMVPNITFRQGRRESLTMDEVRKLVRTPCEYDVIRRASIFSILTGMRHCDIMTLTWSNFVNIDGIWRVDFTQHKTNAVEYMPISNTAYSVCGPRKEPGRYVFEGLPEPSWISKPLKKWIESAGITRNITFHSFRHTFAALQLSLGTDIYTVSKMLGHSKVTTTQIYAKIVDSSKVAAANAIQIEIDDEIQKAIEPARRKI